MAAVLLAGCQEEEGIKRYTVPKPADAEQDRPLQYRLPEGWRKAQPDPFSVATFVAGEGDQAVKITVSPLGPQQGGLLDNINRWREQVKLGRVGEPQMRKELRETEVDGIKGHAVDLPGPEAPGRQRILGVIVERAGQTWFFKVRGPADAVEKQKAAFDEFMASVRFGGGRGGKHG